MPKRARDAALEVAMRHRLTMSDLVTVDRRRRPSHARFEAFAAIRAIPGRDRQHAFSLPKIGQFFGMHHTSVLHGLRWIERRDAKADQEMAKTP